MIISQFITKFDRKITQTFPEPKINIFNFLALVLLRMKLHFIDAITSKTIEMHKEKKTWQESYTTI